MLYFRMKEIKAMDVSIEDDDYTVETVTPVKKKKMKQGTLVPSLLII